MASDPGSGMANWTLSADGATLTSGTGAANGSYEWDGSGLTPGQHTLTLQGKDQAGNTAEVQKIVIIATPTATPTNRIIPEIKLPFVVYPATPLPTNTPTLAPQPGGGLVPGADGETQTAVAPTETQKARVNLVVTAVSTPPPVLTNLIAAPINANTALFGVGRGVDYRSLDRDSATGAEKAGGGGSRSGRSLGPVQPRTGCYCPRACRGSLRSATGGAEGGLRVRN